jgi:hypothetical protein
MCAMQYTLDVCNAVDIGDTDALTLPLLAPPRSHLAAVLQMLEAPPSPVKRINALSP